MQARQKTKQFHYNKNNVLNRIKPRFGRSPMMLGGVEQPDGVAIP